VLEAPVDGLGFAASGEFKDVLASEVGNLLEFKNSADAMNLF